MAGFIRDTAPSATSASAMTQSARTVVPLVDVASTPCDPTTGDETNSDEMTSSEENMTEGSVPLPPPVLPATDRGKQTRFAAAVSMITVSWLVLAVVLVMATVRVQRWEVAPGEAMAVSPRISFEVPEGKESDPPQRHPAENSIRFVTAFGGQLSALDAVLGWIDPHVQVDTYEEHFGSQTPATSRQLGFQSMFGAKQVAEYVAMKRIGLDARFTDGKIIVNELVCSDEPAAKSACRVLNVGDTIERFDGAEVPTLTELAAEMKDRKVGEEVVLTVVPHGKDPDDESAREERRVVLMANPDDPSRAIIGIIPADTRTVELPFDVAISTADIGGPSAGLAFTLGLIDDLTEGNLMGRGKVAATGTMSPDEKVGAIGALRQKAVAVRDAGVTLFLVPVGQSAEELSAARSAAGRGVTIVPVATLQEALQALAANGGDPLPRS